MTIEPVRNPGNGKYYAKHLECLADLTAGSSRVLSLSLRDHTLTPEGKDYTSPDSLALQILHVRNFLSSYLGDGDSNRDRKLVVAGHSIGTYIVLRAVDELTPAQQSRIAHVAGVMPFIATDLSTPQKSIEYVAFDAVSSMSRLMVMPHDSRPNRTSLLTSSVGSAVFFF